jgi:hypothetical protein
MNLSWQKLIDFVNFPEVLESLEVPQVLESLAAH